MRLFDNSKHSDAVFPPKGLPTPGLDNIQYTMNNGFVFLWFLTQSFFHLYYSFS